MKDAFLMRQIALAMFYMLFTVLHAFYVVITLLLYIYFVFLKYFVHLLCDNDDKSLKLLLKANTGHNFFRVFDVAGLHLHHVEQLPAGQVPPSFHFHVFSLFVSELLFFNIRINLHEKLTF